MTPQDQAELARALFEELGDALFLLDPDTDRLIEVNPVALRLTGFTRAEVLAFPATYLFRFEAAGGLQRLRGAFTKTVVFHNQDGFLLRTKEDGIWVPVNLTVSRLHVEPRPLGLIIARDDRDRRNALSQARRIERELRAVLAGSPAALWSAERAPGPDVLLGWQFRYVSPQLARIAARPAEYFTYPFQWADVVHPADRDDYRVRLRRLLAGSDPDAEAVYRVVTPEGAVRWVRDRLQVIRDPTNRPTRLDGCLVDVTEQRQAEEALRQNEQRFRALVEKSRDGIVLFDDKAAVRYVSPAVKAMLGFEPADLVGREAFDFIHPDDVPAARELFRLMRSRPGEEFPGTFRAIAADRSVRVIELGGVNRLADPSVRAVVVNFRDVTERDRAARELARHHALLAGLFASVPDAVCYKDRDLRFLGGNPAFEALAGRPVAELVGLRCADVFRDEWADRVRADEQRVLATGASAQARHWVTLPGDRKALVEFTVSPLRGPDGEAEGVITVGRDVTERDRLEGELRQAQKLDAVGRLAGGIAHDFNNLLTVVLGNLEMVRAGASPAEAAELVAASERAARQAADLTRQMLGFARRQPLRPVAIDLNTLVRDAVGLLRRSIDPRITISVLAGDALRPAVADPVQAQQVLMNLCLNARDAMPDGGTLTIEMANAAGVARPAEPASGGPGPPGTDDEPGTSRPPLANPAGGFVRLSVADTGHGMTEDVRARIFEPFFTTKDVGKGTGLGLAVVYGVATAHGGWVECHSEPGRGTRFDVYLPAGSGSGAPTAAAPEPAPARARGETVLVADDEPGVRDLARQALERYGYRVLVAADGAEAVEVFGREAARIGLVVLDATMPKLSGRQVYEAIRGRSPAVPVVFSSGYPASHFGIADPPPGVAYLNKPYTPLQLAAEVRRLLDERAGKPPASI